jgi:putative ubiquitin-RnfH superfamily antitoxin RatB of RatAB toxin-antitoxin module
VSEGRIRVEVAYAKPEEQALIALEVEEGATVRQAIERSGVLRQFPEIDLDQQRVGIFGKIAAPDQALQNGDRVEIYRPLIADPKEARKRRAAEGKAMRKGAGGSGGNSEETGDG